mgnify:CR=1 FL=1
MSRAMCKYIKPYFGTNHLIENIDELKRNWCRIYGNTRYCKLYMNNMTYQELKRVIYDNMPTPQSNTYTGEYGIFLGLDIGIDNGLEPFMFMIKEDKEMNFNNINIPNMFGARVEFRPKKELSKKYIINKGATVLFWEDGTKTVVKRAKDDEYNKIMGFLWAYFQKTSGLSRTKANEYLRGLVDADELKAIELIKSGKLNDTMGDIAEGLSKALKDMADSFKNRNK